MLYYVIVTLYVIVCALLILTILLQQGKGGDIANAFGGGSSQAVFGARSGATLLTRATSVLAALFVIGAITLTVWGQSGPGSRLRQRLRSRRRRHRQRLRQRRHRVTPRRSLFYTFYLPAGVAELADALA